MTQTTRPMLLLYSYGFSHTHINLGKFFLSNFWKFEKKNFNFTLQNSLQIIGYTILYMGVYLLCSNCLYFALCFIAKQNKRRIKCVVLSMFNFYSHAKKLDFRKSNAYVWVFILLNIVVVLAIVHNDNITRESSILANDLCWYSFIFIIMIMIVIICFCYSI